MDKNKWDEVRRIRKDFIRDDVDDFPYFSELNHVWETLCQTVYSGEPFGLPEPIIQRDADEQTAETPLAAFRYFLDIGLYPPPELLVWLNDAFTQYYQGIGKVELEDVFFGRPKPGVGNGSKRAFDELIYKNFSMAIHLEAISAKHQNRKKLPLAGVAEQLFKKNGELISVIEGDDLNYQIFEDNFPDIASFLRSWRRWKARKARKADK
jgi:hypothetical protein